LGVKTALVGPITAGSEGHVECPESKPGTRRYNSLVDRGWGSRSNYKQLGR
jgi:hypothetical protein